MNWLDKLFYKRLNKIFEHLYVYTLSRVLDNLIELHNNTWDKSRVMECIRLISGISLEDYAKDNNMRKRINALKNESNE